MNWSCHFNFIKTALTDLTTPENHIIYWEGAKIIDKKTNRRTRQIKEAIWIISTEEVDMQRQTKASIGKKKHLDVGYENWKRVIYSIHNTLCDSV